MYPGENTSKDRNCCGSSASRAVSDVGYHSLEIASGSDYMSAVRRFLEYVLIINPALNSILSYFRCVLNLFGT